TRKHWFEPRSLNDIQETKCLLSNDTSLGIGYAPFSKLEQFVLDIERKLNGNEFKKNNPWIGSDIKIMAFRNGDTFDITLCIPQISAFVLDVGQYKNNLAYSRIIIENIAKKLGIGALNININTRDNFENSELYLTVIGSSIESGDEGLVGRGNRINGLITPMRPMSMEGAAGKNPVYHIGKIYYVTAQKISEKIYARFNVSNEIMIASQSGRELLDPWVMVVRIPESFVKTKDLELLIKHEIKNIPHITEALIQRKITVY
ncbi:MAG: methionine adenosyltransferase, partial [bacterium]|nr:methionine adenosyltransferase [bacterium]